ncbi:outer membrane beta-barrel protein [Niastella populi]|uniref:Outer membrane protein beta-barrel domain-containing protein n=1 Tax=Niastella populi TaxID=550983 RepID=A0A1V9FDB9_9BACT|nr:outer membrane beta-barrel protein [Niastella populi]OQP56364.1 hypothetical protein A4R26_26080 [Niastella populi]
MSDHEFEKQVHQKLQELKLRPSDTVWMEVEKNIRQHKRRRRFLWLWSAALLVALTTSGVVLYNYTSNNRKTLEMATGTTTGASSSSSSSSSNQTNKTVSPNSATTNTNDHTTQVSPVQPGFGNAASVPANEPVDVTEPAPATVPGEPGSVPPAAPVITQGQPDISSLPIRREAVAAGSATLTKETIGTNNNKPVKSGAATPLVARNHKQVDKKRTAPVITEEAVDAEPGEAAIVTNLKPDASSAPLKITIPALVHETEPIVTSKAATDGFNIKAHLLMPDSASAGNAVAAMPIQRKTPSLWHWGVKADAGYSRISVSKLFQLRGLLGTDKSYAEDLAARSYSSPNSVGANNQFLNVSANAVPVKKVASPIQPDFAASVGVFIQRTLSPRLKVSVGLEYSYMSVNTQVGKRYDSSIAVNVGANSLKVIPEFYDSPGYIDTASGRFPSVQWQGQAPGQNQGWEYYSQKQRYRFHYIEIPIMLNWQINKGRRLPPIAFEGGVSVGRLFAVDALHYEGVKGVYYEDNSLFNRTQFNFVTGLSVGLLQKSKHPLWIGPDLRYSLNGLVKKEVSTGQYLWSTGISFKMLLGRL